MNEKGVKNSEDEFVKTNVAFQAKTGAAQKTTLNAGD
jgi:hypothetical protein